MQKRSQWIVLGLGVAFLGLQFAAMGQEKGLSHVRIVRLSFVNGPVLVKRPNSTQWARALVNTPIEQGFKVETSGGGFAETQFENGSTARLGENSQLSFTELAIAPDGGKINHLLFNQGYGTFNLIPEKHDVYAVNVANATIEPRGKAEFRVDADHGLIRVEVFDGSVHVQDPKQQAVLGKDKTLVYNAGTEEAFNITHGIKADAWDKWVGQRNQQTTLALRDEAVGSNSPEYGWADLDEYGEWAFFPGFGYGWAPFAPMGWTPFTDGMWSFYPGMGYTWIAGEPWGWLPYHFGAWEFDPAVGYFWMPVGGFGAFYPGLVDWYASPGYVGWAPMGPGGGPACNRPGCVTVMKQDVLQNGQVIHAGALAQVFPTGLRQVSALNIRPGASAMLSGTPVSRLASGRTTALSPADKSMEMQAGIRASNAPSAFVRNGAAPDIVLMGETKAQIAEQGNEPNARHSFFSRAFAGNSAQPLRARLGNTIGGRYSIGVAGQNGPRGNERTVPASREGFGIESRPMFISHRADSGYSTPALRMQSTGSIRMMGGFSGDRGMESAPSGPAASSPAATAPASTPHSMASPAAGGGARTGH